MTVPPDRISQLAEKVQRDRLKLWIRRIYFRLCGVTLAGLTLLFVVLDVRPEVEAWARRREATLVMKRLEGEKLACWKGPEDDHDGAYFRRCPCFNEWGGQQEKRPDQSPQACRAITQFPEADWIFLLIRYLGLNLGFGFLVAMGSLMIGSPGLAKK